MEFFHIQSFSDYSDNHHHHRHSIKAPKVMQKFERGTKRKRKRKECIEGDNSEEAIQVRAKRGQATDRHSLAERVRRKKINERLECLKTLVPGCYETMGMAVMLDAVISYLQSLQNQIEFLSMKLLAASIHYELHTPSTKSNCTTQMASTVHDLVQEIDEKIEREGSGYFHNVH